MQGAMHGRKELCSINFGRGSCCNRLKWGRGRAWAKIRIAEEVLVINKEGEEGRPAIKRAIGSINKDQVQARIGSIQANWRHISPTRLSRGNSFEY